jgi:hypothetical protein
LAGQGGTGDGHGRGDVTFLPAVVEVGRHARIR